MTFVNWFFLIIPIYLSSFCLLKLQRNELRKGKRQGYYKTQFLFSGFKIMFWWRMYSRTVISGQSVRRISGISLANYESFVWGIEGLRGLHMYLWSVGILTDSATKRHHALLSQGPSRNMYSNWQPREKKDVCSVVICKGIWEKVSFCSQDVHLFRHA